MANHPNRSVYESEVRAGSGNSGEYVQVRCRNGKIEARTIELFVHGPNRRGPWEPATLSDLAAANAPREWDRLVTR